MASKDETGKSYGSGRTRNWATVIYPESAPANWEDVLREEKVRAVASPVHDQDVNATGEPKKSHRHVILCFSTTKTEEQAKEVFAKIGGVGCEKVKDLRQYCRYLCHLDNPEKARYTPGDVITFGGFDYYETIMSSADETDMLMDITRFVVEYHVTNFAQFQLWNIDNRPNWFRLIARGASYYVAQLIKSERYNDHEEHDHQHDHQHDQHGKFCPECGSTAIVKNGKTPANTQRFKCCDCGKIFV